MSLTAVEIEQVLKEIEPVIRGGWIQKIHQPTARTLIFEVRMPGQTYRLLVSCQPESCRIHFVTRLLPNPPSPPIFCRFLRAHLQGARIDQLSQLAEDRIVEWRLTSREGPRTVMCELTGRKANVLILDANRIVLRDLNGRSDLVGSLYRPPDNMRGTPRRTQSARFRPAGADVPFPLSAAVGEYYREQEDALALETARQSRLRDLKKTIKKEQRRLEAWQNDLAKAAQYEPYARYGELLKAHLGSVKKGADRIIVVDYFDESMPEVTLPLDPTKSPQGNMDDYFRKYRKHVEATRELRPRIERTERHLEELRRELMQIEQGSWTPPLLAAAFPLSGKPHKRTVRVEERRRPFKRFTSIDGLQMFVGRNAQENEQLTFGLAKSDDLWLHARGAPGSHVVVRLDKGKEPPPGTLHEAAMLALLYSDLKKSGKGEVIYTRRKWVRKAKGQTAGAVTLEREQSLYVNLDKDRLASLKERGAATA
ncbi:MAG TPA: NFACT family protein [Nitrospira sp.]|nr:NFACT family protein [Nitrospira sp.]